ncbi:hypothetical protein K431DRAFT_252125, partial [Polychaeton citri CBS 116435]
MHPSAYTIYFGILGVVSAAAIPDSLSSSATLTSRNTEDDSLYVTFWENGCDVEGDANQLTYRVSNEGPSLPGDCLYANHYNWQSVKIIQDSKKTYTIDLFSGEGCNNFVTTITTDGCFTAPEGNIILTARAN